MTTRHRNFLMLLAGTVALMAISPEEGIAAPSANMTLEETVRLAQSVLAVIGGLAAVAWARWATALDAQT